jgi:hypothetical protein
MEKSEGKLQRNNYKTVCLWKHDLLLKENYFFLMSFVMLYGFLNYVHIRLIKIQLISIKHVFLCGRRETGDNVETK